MGCEAVFYNMEMAERFAILGWGSLLWELRQPFDSHHGDWRAGGPLLKIEFSRVSVSRDDALTLVIDPVDGVAVPTSFCISTRSTLGEAREDLRIREGRTKKEYIGFLDRNGEVQCRDAPTLEAVKVWLAEHKLEGVVWTDLPPNFAEKSRHRKAFSIEGAREHLESLSDIGKAKAREYILNAPEVVKTPLRAALADFVKGSVVVVAG
jgi:hypothetical protein